jgi:hypothetical protein
MPEGQKVGTLTLDLVLNKRPYEQAKRETERELNNLKNQAGKAQGDAAATATRGWAAGLKDVNQQLFYATQNAAMVYSTFKQVTGTAYEWSKIGRSTLESQIALEKYVGGAQEAARWTDAVTNAMGGAVTQGQAAAQAYVLAKFGFTESAAGAEDFLRTVRIMTAVSPQIDDANQYLLQLQLTLANTSFMRLDQLGLSVAQVRDRMAELQEQTAGLSREEAFQQAVLLELGDEADRVGDEILQVGDDMDWLTAQGDKLTERIGVWLHEGFESWAAGIRDVDAAVREFGWGAFLGEAGRQIFGVGAAGGAPTGPETLYAPDDPYWTQQGQNAADAFVAGFADDLDQGILDSLYDAMTPGGALYWPGLADYLTGGDADQLMETIGPEFFADFVTWPEVEAVLAQYAVESAYQPSPYAGERGQFTHFTPGYDKNVIVMPGMEAQADVMGADYWMQQIWQGAGKNTWAMPRFKTPADQSMAYTRGGDVLGNLPRIWGQEPPGASWWDRLLQGVLPYQYDPSRPEGVYHPEMGTPEYLQMQSRAAMGDVQLPDMNAMADLMFGGLWGAIDMQEGAGEFKPDLPTMEAMADLMYGGAEGAQAMADAVEAMVDDAERFTSLADKWGLDAAAFDVDVMGEAADHLRDAGVEADTLEQIMELMGVQAGTMNAQSLIFKTQMDEAAQALAAGDISMGEYVNKVNELAGADYSWVDQIMKPPDDATRMDSYLAIIDKIANLPDDWGEGLGQVPDQIAALGGGGAQGAGDPLAEAQAKLDVYAETWDRVPATIEAVTPAIQEAGPQWQAAIQPADDVATNLANTLAALTAETLTIDVAINVTGDPIPGGGDLPIPKYHTGGYTGTGTGEFLARLRRDEYVIPGEVMRAGGGAMVQIGQIAISGADHPAQQVDQFLAELRRRGVDVEAMLEGGRR